MWAEQVPASALFEGGSHFTRPPPPLLARAEGRGKAESLTDKWRVWCASSDVGGPLAQPSSLKIAPATRGEQGRPGQRFPPACSGNRKRLQGPPASTLQARLPLQGEAAPGGRTGRAWRPTWPSVLPPPAPFPPRAWFPPPVGHPHRLQSRAAKRDTSLLACPVARVQNAPTGGGQYFLLRRD